jgi:predicted TPR repeat methyltransferase
MFNSTDDAIDKAVKSYAKNAAAHHPDNQKVIEYYNNWSEQYEEDLNPSVYRGPAICANVCSMLLTNDQTRILDVGAGTGYAYYSLFKDIKSNFDQNVCNFLSKIGRRVLNSVWI